MAYSDVALNVTLDWRKGYTAENIEQTEQCFGRFEELGGIDCIVLLLVNGNVHKRSLAGKIEEGSAGWIRLSHGLGSVLRAVQSGVIGYTRVWVTSVEERTVDALDWTLGEGDAIRLR